MVHNQLSPGLSVESLLVFSQSFLHPSHACVFSAVSAGVLVV